MSRRVFALLRAVAEDHASRPNVRRSSFPGGSTRPDTVTDTAGTDWRELKRYAQRKGARTIGREVVDAFGRNKGAHLRERRLVPDRVRAHPARRHAVLGLLDLDEFWSDRVAPRIHDSVSPPVSTRWSTAACSRCSVSRPDTLVRRYRVTCDDRAPESRAGLHREGVGRREPGGRRKRDQRPALREGLRKHGVRDRSEDCSSGECE